MEIITPDYKIIVESKKPLTKEMKVRILDLDTQVETLNRMSRQELLLFLLETIAKDLYDI